ncbi:MAG: hypothetical protein N3G74_01380 [Candidatus Micrarchaeota archaeon]|nr:hypothetical protein [Candidatus Micrarchaeota archaeon]
MMLKNDQAFRFKKGQVAFETILIVGFIFLLLIPLLFILFSRAVSIQDELATIETSRSLFTLSSAVDSVGVLGPNNSITVEVSFPSNIKNVSIGRDSNREISAVLSTSLGDIHIVKMTQFNISAEGLPEQFKSGRYTFKIIYSEMEKQIKISLN